MCVRKKFKTTNCPPQLWNLKGNQISLDYIFKAFFVEEIKVRSIMAFEWNFVVCLCVRYHFVVFVTKKKKRKIKVRSLRKMNERKKKLI